MNAKACRQREKEKEKHCVLEDRVTEKAETKVNTLQL